MEDYTYSIRDVDSDKCFLYINDKFYCSADNLAEALKELEKWEKEHLDK